ncbi:hypothetical protein Neosp_009797 [[Neocosmospora] mangrovei]
MASIKWDSELMTNYAEAINVPSGRKFRACVDDLTKHPAVFALSNHEVPKLQLIRVDGSGQRVLLDLSELLSLAPGTLIEAFDVRQSEDLTVYLSFSTKIDDRNSILWIVYPFKLSDTLNLETLPPRPVGRVHDIVIGPYGSGGFGYPAIYLMHQPLSRTASNSDLAQVRVVLEEDDWEIRNELKLPVNVQKILDIAPAYAGVFGHGSLYAVFVRPGEQKGDRGTASQFDIACPQDASSIETFTDYTDNDNRSSLLLGCGTGVRLIRSKQLTAYRGFTPITINNDDCLTGARDLHVSQTETHVSLFAFNARDELAFLTAKIDDLENARAAPILPSGSATSFTALISATNKAFQHSVVCNDERGNLALLQQALDTGIWRHEPFYVESSGEMTPFESYTVNITAMDSNKNPVINGKVKLQVPSILPVIINGRTTMLTSGGSWHSLDNAGEIGLIIPTKSITSQPITVQGLRNAAPKTLEMASVKIDPARKVLSRMSSLDSEKALLDAKTPDGQSIWGEGPRPTQDDIKNASTCFAAIKDAYKTLPNDGSVVVRSEPVVSIKSGPQWTGNLFMDAFLWLRLKAQKVKDWIVRKAGEVWEFVCDIGGKVVSFVLDCVEKVTEAASWVWERLKIGWDKLCKFVGFMFSWSDVLETKDTVVSLVNAAFDTAANRVEGFNTTIDKYVVHNWLWDSLLTHERSLFANIQTTVAKATGATRKPEFMRKVDSKKQAENADNRDLQDSAPGKWAGERMKNGNAKQTVATTDSSTGTDKQSAELVNIWKDRVEPVLASFNNLVDDLAKDIAILFKEDKNLSQEALLSRLGGNLLVNILEIVKKLLQAIVSVVAKLVLVIKAFGNMKLSGGFLNSFYKFISKGKDLTLFEAVALLIAIPSTFIIKIVTGAKTPTFEKIDSNLLESIIAARRGETSTTSVQVASKQTLKDISTVVLGCGCGAAVISVSIKNVKLAWKMASGGVSAGVSSLSPSAIMELFGMVVDAFSLYQDLLVNPAADDTPGKELIDITIAVKCFRLASNALYLLATKLGMENPVADQIIQCIDLISALVNFSLYSAIYAKQLDATSWKDHDEEILITAAIDNFLETLATIGYFTASSLKDKAPPIALVGLACCQAASWGAVATKSATFHSEYKSL